MLSPEEGPSQHSDFGTRPLLAITGAAGYLGGEIARRARGFGFRVRLLVHESPLSNDLATDRHLDVIQGDIRSADTLRELVAGASFVVHAAAQLGSGDLQPFMETNVAATGLLTRICCEQGVSRVVLLSSIEAYGAIKGYIDEETPTVEATHPYALSKRRGEIEFWSALRNQANTTEGVVVRPGMVYGPGSQFWSVRLLQQVQRRRFVLVGGGSGNVFPVHVKDVVDAILQCTTDRAACNETFNLVGRESLTWKDWGKAFELLAGHRGTVAIPIWVARGAAIASSVTGRGPSKRWVEVMTRKAVISSEKIRRQLGWSPVTFDAGMQETERWLRAGGYLLAPNKNALQRKPVASSRTES
jgi:nucleoside-diphosphate-sugar epimerase